MAVAHGFVRRHWQRVLVLRDKVRLSEEALHLVLAGVVGLLGGLANWTFTLANQLLKFAAFANPGDILEIGEGLPLLIRVLTPALGGLAAGLVLHLGLRLMGNPGLTNLLEAVVAGDGRLPLRTALMNGLSSLLSISTGASIGREGTIVQLSATVSSKLGQWARWPPYRLRLLVACGAAAGMAAAYQAPIAGAVFAAQIVLGNFSMNLFAPLVVASVISAVVSRGFFGIEPWYHVPSFDFTRLTQLPWFLLLGALSGALGAAFLKGLRAGGRFCGRMQCPLYLRLGAAGLVVGLIALVYPEVWGNGYMATNRLLGEAEGGSSLNLFARLGSLSLSPDTRLLLGLGLIAGLLLAKFVATVVTVGSGTVGGVFTPTLFLGAGLGSLFGSLLHMAGLGTTLPTGAFAVVGMGSMLAATTHSPLLAMIVIFELSLNYSMMPPLMLACAISVLVARRLHPESVYTEPLRRKGVDLQRESPHLGAAHERTVGDLMRQPVPPLRANTPFREIADRFLTQPYNFMPVVDDQQRLIGVVALQDLKQYLNAGHELSAVIAFDVMRPPPVCLTPNQKLTDALPVLLGTELRHVPVVNNPAENRLLGTVTRAEALGLLSEAISARSALRV